MKWVYDEDTALKRDKCVFQGGGYNMFQNIILATWGCIPELSKDCQDMTNASSTYLGIIVGAIIGAIVSWWIYNRQKKTSEKQDLTLNHIKELDERHDKILRSLEQVNMRHDSALIAILELDKKIERIIERQESLYGSIHSSRPLNNNKTASGAQDNEQ
jgi:uncharacterized membrane protein YgaE (UPF0421/DUF939 family)